MTEQQAGNEHLNGKKTDKISLEGKILQALPNLQFLVELEDERVVTGYLSGKMRQNFIRLTEGDIVTIEFGLYDHERGRIVFRQR